ncbi:DUF4097 domain-containing protein [Ferrimonas sediminicola]|uniref:DUF4097 domain-containing protein n=1 Tax=Ferrimonas sediminicola TaxID=2569538 RepID=A0A4U1BFD5_9GAMM|nr:DUF4097 family beta strand repeat-containing protein [Ferrimonas sediminicola]TKB49387.1 DUF4097 domain-containing protein [Ferrimonas sediminicola]
MKNLILSVGLVAVSLPLWAGEAIDSRLSADGINKLTLIVPRGEVTLTGGDHREIRVQGELDDQAREWVFERDGSTLVAEVKMPSNWRDKGDGSTLTVTLPRSVEVEGSGVSTDFSVSELQRGLELESVSGDLKIIRVSGEVDADSVSGDITADTLNGDIELETVSGDILAEGLEGKVSAESVSGEVSLSRAGGQLEVESVSGDIRLQLSRVQALEVTSVSGDIRVEMEAVADAARLAFETVNGDARLALPADASARFQLETGPGGEIHNRLSAHQPERGEYVPTESLRFSQGDGRARVAMKTINGALTLSPVVGGHLK